MPCIGFFCESNSILYRSSFLTCFFSCILKQLALFACYSSFLQAPPTAHVFFVFRSVTFPPRKQDAFDERGQSVGVFSRRPEKCRYIFGISVVRAQLWLPFLFFFYITRMDEPDWPQQPPKSAGGDKKSCTLAFGFSLCIERNGWNDGGGCVG